MIDKMKRKVTLMLSLGILISSIVTGQSKREKVVPGNVMEKIYNEIKTPFKYGIVFKHPDSTRLLDSPTIFRKAGKWYMTYIHFAGRGYET